LPNSTIVSVKDSGSKLGLSSVLTLKAGKVGNGGIQLFEALDDGVIDFVGLITLTSILPQGASENVKFASATGGEILISALKVLKTSKVQFSADTTGLIDLGSVSEISIGWIALSANEAGSIIDLHSLCTYDGTTFTEILGGKILAPHAIKLSSYEDRAVFGVRSQPQTTTCSGNTCSASQFFSYLPGGYCAAYHGLVKLSSTQLDLDGVAVSQGFGVVGFELLHDPMSGSITSSRLVAIDYKTALATVVGPSLDGRVIRGATFLSDVLLAIDATANALITISPTQGILIGTEIPLILNGLPYDLSDLSDITINKDGAVFIADGNKWFSVNIATGVMAQIAIDVIPLSGTQLPSFSGSTFALAENNTDIELHHLNSNNVDSILSYTPALTQRKVLIPSIPEEAVFDGIYGDLGSTNQFNDTTTSPGLLMRMYSEADMANVLGGFAGKAPQSFTIKTASGTALLQSFILPAVHFANTGSGTLFNYGANAVQDSGSSIGNPLGDDITIIAPQGSGTYGSSYEGYLLIPTGGPVSFNLLLDNRAALYIDDVLILSGDCGVCNSSGNAFLSAGYHKIALYHSDYGGLGTLNLSASGGGLPGGIITAGFFFSSILGAPGPVPITINPQGNGTTVIADWSTYDETLNGDDIHHYNIYKSTTNFSNISAATVIDTVPAGTKSYQLKNLLPTQQIFVAVTATDFAGNVNENVTAVGITPIDIIPPEEVMNIIPVSQLNSVNLSWIPPNTPDLKYFRVYKDNVNVSGDIPKATPSFTVAQLSQATGYDIKITTIDNLDNESLGVTIKVSTLLPNPTGVTGVGENASITASWNPVAPPSLVKNYKVYIESTSFSSVAGLTAKAILGSGILTTKVAGLQNGTQYYVAVTAVNISNGEFSLVSPVTATPQLDQVGPVLTNAKIGGVTLTSGLTVTKSATIEVQATDPAGVSRVDFLLNTGANAITLSQDSSVPYSANWDVSNFDNGPYTIILSAYDTLNNNTQIQYPVTLALAPPEKPTITVPQNGFVTNETILSISGNSELNTTVDLYRNGTVLATALPVNSLGFFTTTVIPT
jgi:hypothetical protein